MFPAISCFRYTKPFVRAAQYTCRSTLGKTGNVSFNSSQIRAFRFSPVNPASVRSRFGKSAQKTRLDGTSPAVAVDVGRIAIAAGAALGLGGLCYYGLSMSPASVHTDAMSALDRAAIWPDYVRQRVKTTYAYLAGGAAIAAGTAAALSRSPAFCRLMLGSGWLAPIGMMIASMGCGVVCQMLPYPESGGLTSKHLAWAVFSASIGGMLMPVCLLGGPLLTRAAVYTGGIVGGLSIVAASAPSDRFLHWGGPLAIGLGVVVVSSLGSMFLSPVSRIGSGMAAISLYGGLLLFSGFLLYDTQAVVRRAESHPAPNPYLRNERQFGMQIQPRPFDPINNSLGILLDTVNIFIRIVAILSGGQRRK
ncbi:putative Growth hormone-inducible transmembrane protein [Fasciola hepatica]|uniref:Growth hormone-inducible transmembrane protein n=2 Tax=Fasciola TaxID=6191 RepID=A0A4E0RU87_FASHE|nr:putative Growth hormone-inducible transmembrane protein [Fasciola hepatica]